MVRRAGLAPAASSEKSSRPAFPYRESFEVLLFKCLEAKEHDQVLVIYDETLQDFQEDLLQTLIEHRLVATFIHLPEAYQRALVEWYASSDVWLPNALHTAVSESTLILNIVNGHLVTQRVRKAILNQQRVKECRLAHIPGISREILQLLSASPIEQILENSERVAWALGEARRAEVVTHDRKGRQYVLGIELLGWDNEPLMSPGVIPPGSWGNIPPGESFWCPDSPAAASGEVCINGSIPQVPLAEDEEAVLRFEDGRLVGWEPMESGPVARFLEAEAIAAQARRDPHWNRFAELGIGLNPAIERLVGNPLFDEKKAGTLHVAIGDNSVFGYGLSAGIHADLVCGGPTLRLDGIEVMSEGELRTGAIDGWRRSVRFQPLSLHDPDELFLRAVFQVVDGHAMRRLWRAGRLGYVRIAEDEDKEAVRAAVAALPKRGALSYGELKERLRYGHPPDLLDRLDVALALLEHYRVIDIRHSRAPGCAGF